MGTDRGQTLPDFAVGASLFLGVVAFVVLFVPQLLVPYAAQEGPVVAERVAGDVEGRLLATADPASAGLDEACTLAFFTGDGGDACPFDADEPPTERVGIDDAHSVNVTLRDAPSDAADSSLLCAVDGAVDDCEAGADRLATGPPAPTDDRSVATARHRVRVGGTAAVLEVEVW